MEVLVLIVGVVKEILINVGDKVLIGKLIMKFEIVLVVFVVVVLVI